MKKITLLALSGSLRRHSLNRIALEALPLLAPEDVAIQFGKIDNLPLFNPDLEESDIVSLQVLKEHLAQSSGLVIASPEYAHGISGPMKNALDWLVSSEEFPGIPIMLINTSPRASHAIVALTEVLMTMSGDVVDDAYVCIPLLGNSLEEGVFNSPSLVTPLETGLATFCDYLRKRE